ncbi:hypothetical protein DSM112329_04486 [Paraconexibacter sp. AEG42_29]|uniref:Uncharacterized protein n=1 Tax=Paraconexibacter sp. AEG42_29 TaxID=2997339 RepID=A0AAU7B107_9ACTN
MPVAVALWVWILCAWVAVSLSAGLVLWVVYLRAVCRRAVARRRAQQRCARAGGPDACGCGARPHDRAETPGGP